MRLIDRGIRVRARRFASLGCLCGVVVLGSCEDPVRPVPGEAGAALIVDSDPRGGRILIDGFDTGERTPALIDQLGAGVRNVRVELDTAGRVYSWVTALVVDIAQETSVGGPLTIRCGGASCLSAASAFQAAGNLRFALNGAGPIFLHEGVDLGIVWPASTSNSYAPFGAATMTALSGSEPVALGLRNAGTAANYWAGRPVPEVLGTSPYHVRSPAWILPPVTTSATVLRGIEIVQEVIVAPELPDVLTVRVTWRNISADSLYRLLDPASPASGVTYTDVWLGFILDPDIGAFSESDDDLVSYDPARGLVFAYDALFQVPGFSGEWSDAPALVGLVLLDGPGTMVRLNAWPRTLDFIAGATDAAGRALLTAMHTTPANHPDPRLGFAPDSLADDYIMSAASGPITLAPGDAASATFAVFFAAPTPGTFVSGQLQAAGDPLDAGRPLAATAARLLQLADSVIDAPSAGAVE